MRKDGQVINIEVMGSSIVYHGGPAIIGTLMDITERNRAAAQLRQAKEEAEAANQAKDRFLAVLSHELRTPLAPVLAASDMMLKSSGLRSDALANLQMIRRNVQLEARLIDNLLDVTRIARGKIELDVRAVDMRQLLRQTVAICWPDLQAKELRLTMDVDHGPLRLRGDPARLQQVFWNLLRNAVKFTPAGGHISLRSSSGSSCRSRLPDVDCELPSGSACASSPDRDPIASSLVVEVSDSGIGIDPQHIDRIFAPFEQGDRNVTKQFGGLGLGLAICKALVELHGGSIAARSAGSGTGSTFQVCLPICSPRLPACDECPNQAPAPAPAPEPAAARPLKLLLVEDHADTAQMMARLLRSEGYSVEIAGNVASALDMASRHQFDLMISDLGLPDGTGHDLMRQLIAPSGTSRQSRSAATEWTMTCSAAARPVSSSTLPSPSESTGSRQRSQRQRHNRSACKPLRTGYGLKPALRTSYGVFFSTSHASGPQIVRSSS